MLRPFYRWQRFEVERDRGTILRRKLRRIAHHVPHEATDRIAVGHVSGLENALDVALRIVADSFRRDVWDPTVAAFRIGAAGKALALDDAAEEVARAVALRAMARAVDQISAAIPRRRFGGVGLELLAVEEKKFPASEHRAELEIERQVVVARLALHRRQRLEIGKQIAHVLEPHALVRGVGKGRIVMTAVGRGPLPHGGDEIRLAPAADAVSAVRRDVRGKKSAERRFQAEPAAELGLVLL